MDVTLHPDLGLFPIGTSVKAYKRSALAGVIAGSFPSGAPSGTEDATATVASDGTLAFTGLTARESYFGYALVSSQHRYFGFSPGFVSPAQPNKLSYDPDTDTVNVEAANFTVDGSAVGGGSTAPTDVLVIGTDIPLLVANWAPADPVTDYERPCRIYKQAGRCWMEGILKAGDAVGASPLLEIPSTHAMEMFGVSADGVVDFAFQTNVAGGSPHAISFTVTLAHGLSIVAVKQADGVTTPSLGELVYFDGISWPLAA